MSLPSCCCPLGGLPWVNQDVEPILRCVILNLMSLPSCMPPRWTPVGPPGPAALLRCVVVVDGGPGGTGDGR